MKPSCEYCGKRMNHQRPFTINNRTYHADCYINVAAIEREEAEWKERERIRNETASVANGKLKRINPPEAVQSARLAEEIKRGHYRQVLSAFFTMTESAPPLWDSVSKDFE